MSEANARAQSTSILELLYAVRAKNNQELSFEEWLAFASEWAEAVIAEYEATKLTPDECQPSQSE